MARASRFEPSSRTGAGSSEEFDEIEEPWEWQTEVGGEKDFFEGEEWEWFGNISRYLVFVTIGFTVLIGIYAAGT